MGLILILKSGKVVLCITFVQASCYGAPRHSPSARYSGCVPAKYNLGCKGLGGCEEGTGCSPTPWSGVKTREVNPYRVLCGANIRASWCEACLSVFIQGCSQSCDLATSKNSEGFVFAVQVPQPKWDTDTKCISGTLTFGRDVIALRRNA